MRVEGNPSHNIDTAQEIEARLNQHEEQEVAKYLEGFGVKSARFQAIANRIDWREAKDDLSRIADPQDTTRQLQKVVRLGNIEETMRRRNNGEIEGYDGEYEPADNFLSSLWDHRGEAMKERVFTQYTKVTGELFNEEYKKEYGKFIHNLTGIKKREVGKRSQPTPPQQ
jgi:hypothetical protein